MTTTSQTLSVPRRLPGRLPIAVCCCALLAGAPAHAGWMDKLFGQSAPASDAPKADTRQRVWTVREFTQVELVTREAGAADNQQPMQLATEALRQQLAQVEVVGRNGRFPLFSADELADLVTPLVQAIGVAGPGADVLLLSSARREGGILGSPMAVTARVFVQGGSLQLIVHDARLDFYDVYRGTHVEPKFVYGSRSAAGSVVLQSPSATNKRGDWLAIPLQAGAAAAAAPASLTAPAPSAPGSLVQAPTAAAPMVATPAATPTRKALDAPAAEDIERRLETVKRLREKNLITEDEYQQKRREILQLL